MPEERRKKSTRHTFHNLPTATFPFPLARVFWEISAEPQLFAFPFQCSRRPNWVAAGGLVAQASSMTADEQIEIGEAVRPAFGQIMPKAIAGFCGHPYSLGRALFHCVSKLPIRSPGGCKHPRWTPLKEQKASALPNNILTKKEGGHSALPIRKHKWADTIAYRKN